MRTRLLGILLALMACVLAALGIPLAVSEARAEQQHLLVDRIDDTARFAVLAQNVMAEPDNLELRTTLDTELRRYHDVYGIGIGVFALDGYAIAAAPTDWRNARTGPSAEPFQTALDGRRSHDPGQAWPWQHGRQLVVASPVVREGDVVAVVVTSSPTGPLGARILHGWLWIAGGEAVAVLLAVAAAVGLTGWVLRPVRDLDKVTHDIATGRLASRVAPAGGPPELRRLARAFNEMADHVEAVLDQQRAFVADASHQLRNPLAALMLRVEALGMELPPGHEQELQSVRVEGQRLARVLDDLLGLAVAENAGPVVEPCDVAGVARERAEGWAPLARERGVSVDTAGVPAGPVSGLADPVGFGSALDAVLDNAIKFTPAGGTVRLAAREEDGHAVVTVTDAGPGLDEEELSRIGDRFWRSPHQQNVAGSGLGLSIARALLGAGGGTLAFRPAEPHGLTVVLTVPRQD
ncbi:sensor histidine kinase [Streptacidiphilus monticola]|uniref:histidine kinase n=1 Tax=Streptacidiphilus monticola TaxID=2161674 RepID=A0ABW1G5F4_9ACTN